VNRLGFGAVRLTGQRPFDPASRPAPYPEGLVITTKVGPGRDPSGDWIRRARPDQLRGQVEENIRQLGLDHLDVVNPRWWSLLRGRGGIGETRVPA
jgi:pyridoxine 4-dehydrogenase